MDRRTINEIVEDYTNLMGLNYIIKNIEFLTLLYDN
jgi:hypothetical protein